MMNIVIVRMLIITALLVGCSMERIPAVPQSQLKPPIPVELTPCVWNSYPDQVVHLLPGVSQINIDIQGPVEDVNDEIKFHIEWDNGIAKGKQTKKTIDDVRLITSNLGAQFEIEYQPTSGYNETLGVWVGWNQINFMPSEYPFEPDVFGKINLSPDGGIVYRIHDIPHHQSRGIAFILCGIGGMQYASRVLGEELLHDGWKVVYFYSVIDTPNIGMDIEFDGTVTSLVELFDDKYCQLIGATKAVQAQLYAEEATLGLSNFVLLGISAGALNTPAVYCELEYQPTCVVLIAGGANMFDIVQGGAVTNWNFKTNNKPLSDEALRELETNYLNTTSRDPYHLAELLPQDKTLIVHAKWDEIVPAENGDLLWKRAGKPERWIYPSGHLGLFATFNQHAPEITNWIDSKINTQ